MQLRKSSSEPDLSASLDLEEIQVFDQQKLHKVEKIDNLSKLDVKS